MTRLMGEGLGNDIDVVGCEFVLSFSLSFSVSGSRTFSTCGGGGCCTFRADEEGDGAGGGISADVTGGEE